MTNSRPAGFTLIELVIFMIVVSIGVVGILSVMNTVVKSSADPIIRKQSAALADSILEEILLLAYQDPSCTSILPTACTNVLEADRTTYNDVDDYNGINEAIPGTIFTSTSMPASLNGYNIQVTVVTPAAANLGTVTAKVITVTVSNGASNSVSMTGYRTYY
jgi:MSHA pilin protein MshD